MVNQNENTKSTDEVNLINFLNSINSSETIKKKKTSPVSLSRLKIAIWNCRGLCTMNRRRKKLTHMLSKGYDINIFIETKLREELLDYFRKYDECKYDVHANTSGNMRGILIMSKRSIPLNMQIIDRSDCGNLMTFTIKHDNQEIFISAVYGPNEDNPNFYEHIRKKMECSPIQHKLLLGDLNLTLDPAKETFNYAGNNNNKEARAEVIKIKEELTSSTLRYNS